MSGLQKGEHVCKGFKLNFHSFLSCSEGVGAEVSSTFLNPIQCSGFPPYSIRKGGLPFPFQAARTADLHLGQWFACVIFPRYFLDPLDAMFEDFVFLADVPPIISSILFQVFFFHLSFRFAYLCSEESFPSVVLSDQFLESKLEV